MGMMERVREWLTPSRASSVSPPAIRTDFMRGNRGVVFGGWRPALREAADDVGASWDLAAARTVDLIQNSGWIAGAIDQAVANTVGTGLRLKAMPENDLFGMTNSEAETWSQTVEQRWSLWADKPYECDIEGRRSFGLLQAAAFRSWFATGEMWAEIPWRERPGGRYGTKVRLVPPHRVVRRNDPARSIVQGVRMDVRFAARQIVLTCDLIEAPSDGAAVGNGTAWADFLDVMAADPDLAPIAQMLRSEIEGTPLADWRRAANMLGILRETADAIGLGPVLDLGSDPEPLDRLEVTVSPDPVVVDHHSSLTRIADA